jgi:hypothetical protein
VVAHAFQFLGRRVGVELVHVAGGATVAHQVCTARKEAAERHVYVAKNVNGEAIVEEDDNKEDEVGEELGKVCPSACCTSEFDTGLTNNEVDIEEVHALLLPCRGVSAAAGAAQVDEANNVPRPSTGDGRKENGKLGRKQNHRRGSINEHALSRVDEKQNVKDRQQGCDGGDANVEAARRAGGWNLVNLERGQLQASIYKPT